MLVRTGGLNAVAKTSCGNLAYWTKDLKKSAGNGLSVSADGGWPVKLVPEGHCDEVQLSAEAGELQGLSTAAMNPKP